jgi:hypothetical protein
MIEQEVPQKECVFEKETCNQYEVEKGEEPTSATTNFAGTKVSDEEYKTVPFSTQNSITNASPL